MKYTLKIYLKEKHPEILKDFEALLKDKKRKQQKEKAREMYALYKKAKGQ